MTAIKQFCQRNLFLYFFILLFSIFLGRKTLDFFLTTGAVISLYLLLTHWNYYLRELKANRYLYICLAFLVPVAVSLIDSLYLEKSISVFFRIFRYALISVLVIILVKNKNNYQYLIITTFYILMFICFDAIVQWLTDYHIYGYDPVEGNRVKGIFQGHHLSYFLGTFAHIIFFYLYQQLKNHYSHFRLFGAIVSILLLITAVIIGGARAGMVSLAISFLLFIIYLFYTVNIKHKFKILLGMIIIVAVGIGIASQSEIVQDRFYSTTSAIGSDQFLQRFTSSRTNIWYVGFKEIPNYWVNGVGPRGFNNLYQTYPEEYKIFPYVWQPHLHGLEVLIETGIIGFIPYLLVLGYLLYRMFNAKAGNEWLMMGFIAMMPINSHVGLYESFWMPLIWIPIMLGLTIAYQTEKSNNENTN